MEKEGAVLAAFVDRTKPFHFKKKTGKMIYSYSSSYYKQCTAKDGLHTGFMLSYPNQVMNILYTV